MLSHVRKGDEVVVTAGKDRGKRGKVLRVIPERDRVVVEGVNMIKKHQRPGVGGRQGGIIEKEASLHISNVMPICPKTNEPTRVRTSTNSAGKKVRVSVKAGAEL